MTSPLPPLRKRLNKLRQTTNVELSVYERDYLLSFVLAAIGNVKPLCETIIFREAQLSVSAILKIIASAKIWTFLHCHHSIQLNLNQLYRKFAILQLIPYVSMNHLKLFGKEFHITTETYNHGFSLAKKYELSQFCPPEELFMAIADKKADVAFNSSTRLEAFERSYPGKVMVIPCAKPLRVLPDTVAVAPGEQELLNMLNTAIDRVTDSDLLEKLVAKYRTKYNMDFIIPVSCPYNTAQPRQNKYQ